MSPLVKRDVPVRAGRPPPAAPPTHIEDAPPHGPSRDDATEPIHWVALTVVGMVALALRLRDPLSTPILGAEDPYLFMERTWNLLQGWEIWDYPVPGFMYLMAPFAMLGTDAFYWTARLLPAAFGVTGVVGTFFLTRHGLGPWPGLAGATIIAFMPEHITRTNLLFPTALDMAVLPFLLLVTLRAAEGARWALIALPATAFTFLAIHPWFVALLLPPVGLFLLFQYVRRHPRVRAAHVRAGAATFGVVGVFLFVNPVWSPWTMIADRAWPRFMEIVTDPSTLTPLPAFVDLPSMLTWAGLLLGVAGAGVAVLRRRTPFALLAVLWTFLLLPLVLVNWFQLWYLPHRTVAFMATGVAMLGALAVAEAFRFAADRPWNVRRGAAIGAVVLVALLMLPQAATMEGWYRLYDKDDYAAWETLEERGAPHVMAGSWQTRAGYRALTGGGSGYFPSFFHDAGYRDQLMEANPDLVVIVSNRTVENGHPTDFLDDWRLIGEWGDVRAYEKP